MKGSTKSDIGVEKRAALEKFTSQFEMAVRQKKMSEDRKEVILFDIKEIAAGN